MKVYVVIPGTFKVTDDEDAQCFFAELSASQPFIDEEEADNEARRLARLNPGKQFWVVHGLANKAFRVEPQSVIEETPTAIFIG